MSKSPPGFAGRGLWDLHWTVTTDHRIVAQAQQKGRWTRVVMDTALEIAAPERADGGADALLVAGAGPPLAFIQIAFAGHNREDDLGDPDAVAAGLRRAWTMLSQGGVRQARLLTGHAGGADKLAVETWRGVDLGPVQAVLPFLDDDDASALPDDLAQSAVLLDGAATRAIQRSPHLAQTRWLIGAADLLVAVWSGRAPRGSGGTADAVRLALEHGVPVLWMQPNEDCALRLIRPEFLFEDCGFLELLEQIASHKAPLVSEATPEQLHAALADLGLSEAASDEAPDDVAAASAGRLPWPWRAYDLFRRALGGRGAPFAGAPAPPDLVAQPGFARLSQARAAAAAEAKRLGAIHRSQQVILLAIAIVLATAGSAPALWPDLKVEMVTLELLLALVALGVWLGSERRGRHLQWGEARKRAEDLRLERAAWTLGVSTVPHDLTAINAKEARQARRLAGLPQGRFDAARVQAWGAWAVDELLAGQAAYHRNQALINGRVSHRVHQMENTSFAILLALLVGYIGASAWFAVVGGHTPRWLGGVMFMAGAIVPAIGAAGLALEATLSLGEQARRSRALATRLEALKGKLAAQWDLDTLQAVARTAIRLQRAQEDHWSDDVGRRRLFRGG